VYNPQSFREERIPVLHELLQQHSLASLVTFGAGGLTASHIPLLLEPDRGPLGTLYGHVSRANPQWRDFSADIAALAIFAGPQRYISPSWYPSKQETGKVVPTWNYAVVHAYGTLEIHDDPDWLRAHVGKLTARHESQFPRPWSPGDAPPDYIRQLLNGIVGIELPIAKLEGKWKVSQNRPAADRLGVAHGLEQQHGPESEAMAALVRRYTESL
jgi:transcriptional regulator